MQILNELARFIDTAQKQDRWSANEWISDDNMQVYVRKGRHFIDGKMRITLDLATIAVNEDKQGQGLFTSFLEKAIELNPWDAIFVECVCNPTLATFLLRYGLMQLTVGGNMMAMESQNYYLPKKWKHGSRQQIFSYKSKATQSFWREKWRKFVSIQ